MTRGTLAALASRCLSRGLAIGLASVLSVCGGGSSPASRTPVPAGPLTIPVTPATPAPAPQPASTPAPGQACPLGMGAEQPTCSRDQPSFLRDVNDAIDLAIVKRPDIFNLNEQNGGGNYKILSVGQFYIEVMRNLEAKGFCVEYDGEEVGVKSSNDFDDHYQIKTSANFIWRGPATYKGSCYPASFPRPRPALPPPPAGCSIPSSQFIACGKERSHFLPDIDAAIETLAKQHPDLVDVNNLRSDTPGWYKIKDRARYVQTLMQILGAQGLCTMFVDDEELAIKKDNTLSDTYQPVTGTEYAYRGEGSYRGTCYPAGF